MNKKEAKIPVMEIFGPTIQGEGMVIGQKTMFVRTAGCDYSCSWCDSKFTWDGTEKDKIVQMTGKEVLDQLKEIGGDNFNHVTISGGNPALIRQGMKDFIDLAHSEGYKIGLETQGSRYQDWMVDVDDLTISPKPPSSKMTTNFEMLDSIIKKLDDAGTNFSIKIVIFNEEDLAYAKKVFARYRDKDALQLHYDIPYFISVGNLDPYTGDDITKGLLDDLGKLFDMVIKDKELNDVRPLPQLHTLVWGNLRGV